MSQVYNLDLETMLSTLSRRQLSGSLVANIPRGKVGRESAYIEITVDSGKILFCSLLSGQTNFTGESAIQIIVGLGVIPWSFTATTKQSSSTTLQTTQPMFPAVPRPVPRRLVVLQPADLARLPRSHFHTYAYIDGRRTVEEIAHLLRVTPKQIEDILFDLQKWQVIQ